MTALICWGSIAGCSTKRNASTSEFSSSVAEIFSFAGPSPRCDDGREEERNVSTTQSAPRTAFTLKNPTLLIVVAAALILSAAMGIRQTFGLFIGPFSYDRGLPVTLIAFAIALHNLVWGFAQPFAGAAADRYGAAPVVAFGATTFAAGLALAAGVHSGIALIIGLGLLVGIGISCTTFGVVLTAVGRVATAERRSMAMG